MKKIDSDSWDKGFMCACAGTLKNHGDETIVYDTFTCNPLTEKQMRRIGVDENDIEVLKPIIAEWQRKRKSIL